MRLIQATTLEFVECFEPDIPAYAILSHRWGPDEVSFQDYHTVASTGGSRFRKIRSLCDQAIADQIDHVWIDTCCIDKTNSAELSEAINSMFRWYMDSAICYAFLADYNSSSDVAECDLFTRGWTLQELVAPNDVHFFDNGMNQVGTRNSRRLEIETATGIPPQFMGYTVRGLEKVPNVWSASVAQRMCWASQRIVTKREDTAYCLLGVFDVNIPLLYGEGERKAFLRLQHAIIAQSDDESLFAWTTNTHEIRGMLARHPREFSEARYITPRPFRLKRPPYTLTNRGLEFHRLPRSLLRRVLVPGANRLADNEPTLVLQCAEERPGLTPRRVGISLVRTRHGVWARAASPNLTTHRIGRGFLDTIYPGGWFKMHVATTDIQGFAVAVDALSLTQRAVASGYDAAFLALWGSAACSWSYRSQNHPMGARDVMESCLLLMIGWKWTGLSYLFLTATVIAATLPTYVARFLPGAWLRPGTILNSRLLDMYGLCSRWTVMFGMALATVYEVRTRRLFAR
ncbi:Putative heterokaryon incompatibility [Septoria linicola]|uniref:Heterokaryon incompatibility n=1 Tax=Septoria linicola TaxID=215465 RepID=A0A9Q9B4Y5_9PEZI|nr:Putative heterokaryon incompatibility [Septoria linicola]